MPPYPSSALYSHPLSAPPCVYLVLWNLPSWTEEEPGWTEYLVSSIRRPRYDSLDARGDWQDMGMGGTEWASSKHTRRCVEFWLELIIVPENIPMVSTLHNPAVPVSLLPSPSSPSPLVAYHQRTSSTPSTQFVGIGPARQYLSLWETSEPSPGFPSRPIPGSVLDLDLVLEQCDLSTNKVSSAADQADPSMYATASNIFVLVGGWITGNEFVAVTTWPDTSSPISRALHRLPTYHGLPS
jgi:hypothetical protein